MMRNGKSLASCVPVLLVTLSVLIVDGVGWAQPATVSPGEVEVARRIDRRCPTFSWGVAPSARGYELAVYALDRGADPELVLREMVAGTASSYTPMLEQCLVRGERYAWSVRALGDQVEGPWSTPRLFEPALPSREEVAEALDTLLAYLGDDTANGTSIADLAAAAASNQRRRSSAAVQDPRFPSATPLPFSSGASTSAISSDAKSRVAAKSATTAPAAVHGEMADTGENVGVRGVTSSSSWGSSGVLGWATGDTNVGLGVIGVRGVADDGTGVLGEGHFAVRGRSSTLNGIGVLGQGTASSNSNTGVWGEANSPEGTGVFGWNKSTTGDSYGVEGQSDSSTGIGVFGTGATGVRGQSSKLAVVGFADTTSGSIGVLGESGAASGIGVHGKATNSGAGVRGESNFGNPIEGYQGPSTLVFRVANDGDVFAEGSFNCGLADSCFNAGAGADVAERIDTEDALEPGDVVEIDPEHPGHFRRSRVPYSRLVAGVVSTRPGFTLNNNDLADNDNGQRTDERPLLALAGQVPVKASSENGPIRPGDFLTTASIPGHAARCSWPRRCFGRTIGKALEALDEDTGMVLTMVDLQ